QNAMLVGEALIIPDPSPGTVLSGTQVASVRGMVDSAALQMRYHDKRIHKSYMPTDTKTSHLIFDAAERARVESIGSLQMSGIAKNIENKIIHDFLTNDYETLREGEPPPVNQAVYLLVREVLTGQKPPLIAKNLMEKYGNLIKMKVGNQLKQLAQNIDNQEAFAKVCLDMIKRLKFSETGEMKEQEEDSELEEKESRNESPEDNNDENQENEKAPAPTAAPEESFSATPKKPGKVVIDERDSATSGAEIKYRPNIDDYAVDEPRPYKIYTKEFDQIVAAEDLYDNEELISLRNQLDRKLEQLKNINRKAANQFLRKLLSEQSKSWNFNLEDGILDGRKLPTLIADPNYLEYCKTEKESENSNTIVSLLLDNSGSMRGRPITVAAMSAEILAKTLEACGLKVEILGFTTVEWKGGNSRKKWQEAGGVNNPGRLNDLRHIIYKSADTPWRKARKNLGVMLKEGILKENIDGEAIIWACRRLSVRPEKRRILMVISDGAPVDDSTISSNSVSYLDSHLRQVIKSIEKKSDIELVAIGIGHDVNRYYTHAVTIKEVDELEGAIFQQLTEVFQNKKAA
ncbi:MAG: cobaltochelatase subunit CobT, partial [Rickettsiaceae bacterium]|nr:cobaltochelatase subunit CobT [Rickettsiaceae bacterium]